MNFEVQRNDISQVEADAVVLPANWRLAMGTGASMALFEAAGKERLEAECAIQRKKAASQGLRLNPGVTIPTHAFDLPATFILHAVVPKWDERDARKSYDDLCKAYSSALAMADRLDCKTVAFPVLAAGNNKFDADIALEIALQSLGRYVPTRALTLAYLVTFGDQMTRKVRAKGYEVEERIGQRSVFEQGMHQAKVLSVEEGPGSWKSSPKKAPAQELIDNAVGWIAAPENQRAVFDFASLIVNNVLPDNKAINVARSVLNIVSPFIPGSKR